MISNPIGSSRKTTTASASVGQQENRETIADRMEALAIELRSMSDKEMQIVPSQATLLALAGKIYSARRKVDEIFGMVGFSVSPAWDIMLDLYKAKIAGRAISVTSASIGALAQQRQLSVGCRRSRTWACCSVQKTAATAEELKSR